MIEARQFCPKCKNIDIDIQRSLLVNVPSTAACGHCGWAGLLKDCDGVVSREHLHGAEDFTVRLMNLLITRAVGPLTLELERLGLFPKREQVAQVGWNHGDLQRYNNLVDEVRGDVFKELIPLLIEQTILACGKAHDRVVAFKPGPEA
jgi:hypothetical protein